MKQRTSHMFKGSWVCARCNAIYSEYKVQRLFWSCICNQCRADDEKSFKERTEYKQKSSLEKYYDQLEGMKTEQEQLNELSHMQSLRSSILPEL